MNALTQLKMFLNIFSYHSFDNKFKCYIQNIHFIFVCVNLILDKKTLNKHLHFNIPF